MPNALTGSRALDVLLWLASVVTAVGVVGGFVWWLVKPRVQAFVSELLRGMARVEQQVAGDHPDTISRHARVAAGKASAIEQQLADVVTRQQATDEWRQRFESRLGAIEGIVLAMIGPELRRRIAEDLQEQDLYRKDQHHD